MELHQRLTNLVQRETDRLLKDFLNENPDLLQKYVDGGVTAVGVVLNSLNTFMRHLLVVKGLDPDTEPGERQRRELMEAVGSLFNGNHKKDFDDDYDFSWVHKKFEEARGHLKELTKEKFLEMTDISKLPNIGPGRYPTVQEEQEYFSEFPASRLEDKEIPVSSEEVEENFPNLPPDLHTKEGRQQFRERVIAETQDNPIDRLRTALKEIIKETADKSALLNRMDKAALSEKFNPGDAIKKVEGIFEEINKLPKKGIKTSKKKVNKGPDPKGAPAWGSKQPRVRRVPSTKSEQQEYAIKLEALRDIGWEKKARARALVHEMVERGLVANETQAIERQFEEAVMWTDDAMTSMENVIRKHAKLPTDNKFTGSFRRTQK